MGEDWPIISVSWQSAIWAGPLVVPQGEGGSPRSWEARVGVGCVKGVLRAAGPPLFPTPAGGGKGRGKGWRSAFAGKWRGAARGAASSAASS